MGARLFFVAAKQTNKEALPGVPETSPFERCFCSLAVKPLPSIRRFKRSALALLPCACLFQIRLPVVLPLHIMELDIPQHHIT